MRRSNFVPTKIFARFSRLIEGDCRSKLKLGSDAELFMSRAQYIVRAYSNDVTRPYWCSKTMHETAAILLFQTNPVGFGPFFCHFFFCCCSNKIRSIQSVKISEWLNQLERLFQFGKTQSFNSPSPSSWKFPLENRLWNGFDSDTELSRCRTEWINYYNVFYKQLNSEITLLLFSSAESKIGAWIN